MTASRKCVSLFCLLLLCMGFVSMDTRAQASGSKDPGFYVKKSTWQETMLATRARCLEGQEESELLLTPWHATAPLAAKEFARSHFPVKGVKLDARDGSGQALWTKRPEWVDGKVHGLPLKDHASTYLYRTITTTQAMKITAQLGSDDGLELWLNGKKVISKDVPRGVSADQDQADLDLVAGENQLLFKIHNIAGGHGFYFSLRKDPLLRVWRRMKDDFPRECGWMMLDLPGNRHFAWFHDETDAAVSRELVGSLLETLKMGEGEYSKSYRMLCDGNAPPSNRLWLELYAGLCRVRESLDQLDRLNLEALARAVDDLTRSFPDAYAKGADFTARLAKAKKEVPEIKATLRKGDLGAADSVQKQILDLLAFKGEALQANPLLDFDRLLLVKRKANSPKMGLPQNWQGNCSLSKTGFEDELQVLSPVGRSGRRSTFFKPEKPAFVGDLDLDFDGERMLFSMPGSHNRWQIWELGADGESLRQLTPGEHPDVDNYDACYLPDGRIIFDSTRCFQGIPCVGGADQVANLFIMHPDGTGIRQLCFDQDHDWCPTVLNNGRVLYTRWEYSDTPHYFTRLLFSMNPDGTSQMEFYGSNSFWPNSIFYARPVPGHPTMVAAIVSGHHGVARMGELVLFDPARGRHEADGVVQRIPGFGEKVEPLIRDQLVNDSWPRFLHPFPLSDKYFLVSCQPAPGANWGIYLADVFDNLLCLAEEPGYALLEPTPFKAQERPPLIPDKVDLTRKDSVIYLADVYRGQGLEGVPRGAVKKLRVYEFHYCYNRMGGHIHVGIEGPWDVHRILGTVPVYPDGSAVFRVPANTPIAVQPLDEEGKAMQVMRSWFTAMPGETLSCVGCHERQNTVPPVRSTLAARRMPETISPWYGPTRGFSFEREVQPVLDRNCTACHNGEERPDGCKIPDFSRKPEKGWSNFTHSYIALHPYVRRPGPESDYHVLKPMEFHADTSELIQMLAKGHHNVQLTREDWDRLVTWIDLNVPAHGTWKEHANIPEGLHERRMEMMARYANRHEDPEAIPELQGKPVEPCFPEPMNRPKPAVVVCDGWPFDKGEAQARQKAVGLAEGTKLNLGEGVDMELALIPAGEFIMGSFHDCLDEAPAHKVVIDEPFYLGCFEVTRAQYSCFDPNHHNGYMDQRHKDHTRPGYTANEPNQPVIRVSWNQAMAFCQWLSEKTGYECVLPTESQWEWACRAGTDTALYYGMTDNDFAAHANLADLSIRELAVTGIDPHPIPNPSVYQDFLPKEERFDDGERLMIDVGQYLANPWGLHDMHGNVSEWTLSDYAAYPGGAPITDPGKKVVRGGSWRDRPLRARSTFRLAYRPYQPVFNVGFRVMMKPATREDS